MTDLRALLAAATPGPWAVDHGDNDPPDQWEFAPLVAGTPFCDWTRETEMGLSESDAALIVAAVNALPALLDVAAAAREMTDWFEDPTPRTEPAAFALLKSRAAALRAALDRLDEVTR